MLLQVQEDAQLCTPTAVSIVKGMVLFCSRAFSRVLFFFRLKKN